MDRNVVDLLPGGGIFESLSARRAWIEMEDDGILSTGAPSLSARRAWIEMPASPGEF